MMVVLEFDGLKIHMAIDTVEAKIMVEALRSIEPDAIAYIKQAMANAGFGHITESWIGASLSNLLYVLGSKTDLIRHSQPPSCNDRSVPIDSVVQ